MPQRAVGAGEGEQLQIVVLAVTSHVLPGDFGLTTLLPEGPTDEDQQQDSEHFSHQRVPSVR
ncbi:hypothetical protein D3C80_2223890 [compost metagenome]